MQPKITRYTTAEEQANIVGVNLSDSDVDHFMDLVRKGLVSAASRHESAVQDDMALSAEVSIRLGRPVRAHDGAIEEVVGRETVEGRLVAHKVYADPALKPVVD